MKETSMARVEDLPEDVQKKNAERAEDVRQRVRRGDPVHTVHARERVDPEKHNQRER
jgi:hypothetical protein